MHAGKKFMERFWYHVKQLVNAHTSDTDNPHKVSKTQIGLGNVENKNSATIRGEITSTNVTAALGYTPLDAAKKGATNGVAELDSTGKVPSAQLPSFVDDVVEGYLSGGKFYKESAHTTQITGESGKIYVDLTTGKTYRWSGSAFVEISQSLALGETSTTAYRGDRGKTAYDHSLKTSGNPHGVTKSDVGLGNVPNVATNDQTPTFTTANDDTALVSGEKLSISLGKIARSILSVISLKKQVDELNSKLIMQHKNGIGCSVSYNDSMVIINIQVAGLTMNSNTTTTKITLPDNVAPTVGSVFINTNVLNGAWGPCNVEAYLHFNGRNPTIRYNVGSVSDAIIVGCFTFPRSWFKIT